MQIIEDWENRNNFHEYLPLQDRVKRYIRYNEELFAENVRKYTWQEVAELYEISKTTLMSALRLSSSEIQKRINAIRKYDRHQHAIEASEERAERERRVQAVMEKCRNHAKQIQRLRYEKFKEFIRQRCGQD